MKLENAMEQERRLRITEIQAILENDLFENEEHKKELEEELEELNNLYCVETIEYREIDTEEKYVELDVVFCFFVPREWAENWCKKNDWDSLDEFDNEYIWNYSWDMYCSAENDDVVDHIEEIEKYIIYEEYHNDCEENNYE